MRMEVIRCANCGAPISLRSKGIHDAFTPEADELRRKYHGRLKLCSSESSEHKLCAECYEKKLEATA